jgi:hypothetical protein
MTQLFTREGSTDFRAARIATLIEGFADLDGAIAYAANYAYDRRNDTSAMLSELLAEKTRLAEAAETLDERAFRLGLKAAGLDVKADQLRAEAAQDDLIVIARRARFGDADQPALSIEARARATRTLADNFSAEAERLRSQAGALRRTAPVNAIMGGAA